MKKIFFAAAIISIFNFEFSVCQAQTGMAVPFGSFEQWTSNPGYNVNVGFIPVAVYDGFSTPAGWNHLSYPVNQSISIWSQTVNINTSLPLIVASQESGAVPDGNSAVKLQTFMLSDIISPLVYALASSSIDTMLTNTVYPSILTTGAVDIDHFIPLMNPLLANMNDVGALLALMADVDVNYIVTGGIPLDGFEPSRLTGSYKFHSAVSGDNGGVLVLGTHYNSILQRREVVGGGVNRTLTDCSTYTPFTVDYLSLHAYDSSYADQTPDSLIVMIVSSAGLNRQQGSWLCVDSLALWHDTVAAPDPLPEPDTCARILSITLDSSAVTITSDSLIDGYVATWQSSFDPDGWEIEYGVEASNVSTLQSPLATLAFPPLLPGSRYEMRVRSRCNDTVFGDWDSIMFSTIPLPVDTTVAPPDTTVVPVDTSSAIKLTNLVIFLRFADDEEIDHSFADIDSMFNGRTPGFFSVFNYYDAMTYGQIHYNTIYPNNIRGGVIVSYRDIMPRGYYQPYTEANPIGYTEPNPFIGISMREAQLQARAFRYVDSLHLVSDYVVLDGDGDGFIDNVSFIVKGGVGEWASLLWPHMEFFPHDSIDHPVTVNGIRPNTFNFEFEGATDTYFKSSVFCHEMGHSLRLPDLYHYTHYTSVSPAGTWDMMCNNHQGPNHIAAIYKNRILHVGDDPVEITCDGDYTLLSVGSSPTRNCYYIKSSIDSTQWFTFEYRNREDLFEEGIPGTGLIAARWNDTVPLDYSGMFANAFFNGTTCAHQYWIFRPWSDSDTEDGVIEQAHFCASFDRTSFGPATNPHPYLTDGTPETSFEITDIREDGDSLTFHVHFLDGRQGIAAPGSTEPLVRLHVENGRIVVDGAPGEEVTVYDIMGRVVSNSMLPPAVYVVRVGQRPAQKIVVGMR